jgi:AcrR family transcriptional regulator
MGRTSVRERRHRQRDEHVARAEQKQLTRQALLDAALRLLSDQSFDSLSLREVTREVGIVPTAFYRHFESMEELGLVLVDESFRTMRRMIRAAREGELPESQLIKRSVETLVQYVQAHRPYFRFLMRERFGGVASIRAAIRNEIRLFISELATDLARVPQAERYSTEDIQMVAGLLVSIAVNTTEQILELHSREGEAEIMRMTEKQMRYIVIAALNWQSKPSPA